MILRPLDGTMITPWRVTLVARDLNGLVNSDAIQALNPAPDPRLFSDTAYIKPGRCVWRWLTHGLGTREQERRYVDHAAALGFEYSLIDDGWEKWPDPWGRVRELAAHGRERGVGILVWKNSRELRDPANGWAAMRSTRV